MWYVKENFDVRVLGTGKKRIAAAVSLFFDNDPKPHVKKEEFTHWATFKRNGASCVALFREDPENLKSSTNWRNETIFPLPFKMSEQATTDFLWNWFSSLVAEDYGPCSDFDGSAYPECFLIESRDGHFDLALVMTPTWAEFHK